MVVMRGWWYCGAGMKECLWAGAGFSPNQYWLEVKDSGVRLVWPTRLMKGLAM